MTDRDPERSATTAALFRSASASSRQAGSLDELVNRLVPVATDSDIEMIERVLRDAQVSAPADAAGFVRDVNRLLDVCGLRIRLEDGVLARLRVLEHPAGRSYVQFFTPSLADGRRGGGRGGFSRATISVVRVPSNYHGGHRNPIAAAPAPHATPTS